MKNRRKTTNENVKFKGTLEKFNALLDVVKLSHHESLSEKNSSRLEDEKAKKQPDLKITDDQVPRKKRSLRPKPKKMIIDAEVSQKRELVLPGSDVDRVFIVAKEKKMLQSKTQEKSSSGEAVRLRPEIPDLNLASDETLDLNLASDEIPDLNLASDEIPDLNLAADEILDLNLPPWGDGD